MKWTKERPTVSGWYWLRSSFDEAYVHHVNINEMPPPEGPFDAKEWMYTGSVHVEWAGPIPEPED